MEKKRVIVVDDDEMTRELICNTLRQNGFECQGIIDGLHAVLNVREQRPDLAILDIMLPDLSGLEVMNLIQFEFMLQVPTLIISRIEHPKVKIAANKLGAVGYLVKPFEMEELMEKIFTIPGFHPMA